MTQAEAILKALENGEKLTPLEALYRFKCLRLSSRIYDLKQAGHDIETEMIHDERTGKRYASYRLVRKAKQAEMF